MSTTCSFCRRGVGVGVLDGILKIYEAFDRSPTAGWKVDFKAAAERLRKQPNRKVKLLLPGPGDINMCDICIDLYAQTAKRELAARD